MPKRKQVRNDKSKENDVLISREEDEVRSLLCIYYILHKWCTFAILQIVLPLDVVHRY